MFALTLRQVCTVSLSSGEAGPGASVAQRRSSKNSNNNSHTQQREPFCFQLCECHKLQASKRLLLK